MPRGEWLPSERPAAAIALELIPRVMEPVFGYMFKKLMENDFGFLGEVIMTVDKMIELSLLDYLTYKTNCTYLSDLPHASWSKLLRVLERTPHQAFSAENWRECFAYLIHTQLPDCVIDSHEVRYQLIHYLRHYHA